jgi:chorismate mutase-like protein
MNELDGWRARIDEIDGKLVELLNERARCAIEIGRIKSERGMNVRNPRREQIVLNRVKDKNRGPLDHSAVQRIFQKIIEECRQIEITADS